MIAGHSLPNCSNFQTNPGNIKLFKDGELL